jgi:uncharacterized membrane protein
MEIQKLRNRKPFLRIIQVDENQSLRKEDRMKTTSVFLVLIAPILLAPSPATAEALYNLTDLGSGCAMAISDNGQIVGHLSGRAMLFDPTGGGNNIVLDNQDGIISYAFSINNDGQIVGNIEPSHDRSQAVIFDPTGQGNHTYLSTPNGFSSYAYSINNSGQIVGCVTSGSGPSIPPHERSWVATLFDHTGGDDNTYLGPMVSGNFSVAYSINDNGQIVGSGRYDLQYAYATLFDATGEGNNIDLGTIGTAPSIAWSINNIGQIVGLVAGPIGGDSDAILFDPTGQGNNVELGAGKAKSINDSGHIVGGRLYRIAPMSSHAILFDATGEGNNVDLNTLIDPNLGWVLTSAECINNNGWIVGRGTNPDGYSHAYLLKPILPAIEAEVDINPHTLNLRSKGKWITCHISLPEGYNVADIDSYSVTLEDEIPADWIWFDEDQQVVMAKFSRREVQEMLCEVDTPAEVELVVSGELSDGTIFEGMDTIRVIDKGRRRNSLPGRLRRRFILNRKSTKGL